MVPKSNKKEKNRLQRIIGCIWEEFIYGGHLLALGPLSISLSYMILNRLTINWKVLLGMYLITYFIYGLDRYLDAESDLSNNRKHYNLKMKKYTPWLLLIASLIIVALFVNNATMLIFAVFLLFAGYIYTKFFKGLTKYILGFKSYYTAAVFALTVFFTASFYGNNPFSTSTILIYIFFFLRWFANTTFCDLKDMKEDSTAKLKTFAVVFPKQKLYMFFYLTDLLSIVPIILGYYLGYLPFYSLLLIFAPVYRYIYLDISKRRDVDYYFMANVWADGEAVVWLVSMFIGGVLWVY